MQDNENENLIKLNFQGNVINFGEKEIKRKNYNQTKKKYLIKLVKFKRN